MAFSSNAMAFNLYSTAKLVQISIIWFSVSTRAPGNRRNVNADYSTSLDFQLRTKGFIIQLVFPLNLISLQYMKMTFLIEQIKLTGSINQAEQLYWTYRGTQCLSLTIYWPLLMMLKIAGIVGNNYHPHKIYEY